MIFKEFESGDIILNRIQTGSAGLWSNGTSGWTSFFTSALQSQQLASPLDPLNGLYYLNVYDGEPSNSNSDVYFSIAYGHTNGSGSSTYDTDTSGGSLIFPTKAIYSQYKNILLAPEDSRFTFLSEDSQSVDSDDIYAINFRTGKCKDRLDPFQFEMSLSGSLGTITVISDCDGVADSGRARYNLIQGVASTTNRVGPYEGIGAIYPDLGIVVLNPTVIHTLIGYVNINGINYSVNNPMQWAPNYNKLNAVLFTAIKNGASIKASAIEYVPKRIYFVRAKNSEFNYSNNPSFPALLNSSAFVSDPKVYPTTVGLYDDANNLVAVAKLSSPTLKDFSNELLIKIVLKF